MQKEAERYLLDTSAIFTFTDNEEGSDVLQAVFESAARSESEVYLSAMSVMELYYISLQELGEDAAHRILILVRSLPVKELSLTDDLVLAAADLKARYRISVADAWIAATARVRALTLIHKDPEFEPLKDEVAMKELPFRLSRPRKRRT